jgi:hypothetical protein
MILKIRQNSEKKEAIIGAKSARQVPALGDFCVACEKRVNDSDVCSPIDSGVHAKSVVEKPHGAQRITKLSLQPLRAAPSKDGSLIDLRKYAVSLPYLALCALTEPAIISGPDFITRIASGLFLIDSAATRLDSSAPAGVSNTLTVVQLSSPVSIP